MIKVHEDEIFTILTGKVNAAINRTLLRAFAAENVDITTEQWTVLACLWNKDKVTQQTLSTLTSKDKPSITRLLDKLETRKLVVRIPDNLDRRSNLIHLTEEGSTLQEKATLIVQRVAEKTLQDLNQEELNLCRVALKKIIANLE